MVEVNLNIMVKMHEGEIEILKSGLKKKGLTFQEAVDKGLRKKIPLRTLKTAIFLAAIKGINPKAVVKTQMSKGGYHEKERDFRNV